MLKNEVPEHKVWLKTLEWHDQAGSRFLRGTRVTKISVDEKTVTTNRGREIPWDALLVATAGRPNPASGGDAPNVLNFQYFDETVAISRQIDRSRQRQGCCREYARRQASRCGCAHLPEWPLRHDHLCARAEPTAPTGSQVSGSTTSPTSTRPHGRKPAFSNVLRDPTFVGLQRAAGFLPAS